MKIDICIFLFMPIATFVHACGPQDRRVGMSFPVVAPVHLVAGTPSPTRTVTMMAAPTPAPTSAPAPQVAPAAPAPAGPAAQAAQAAQAVQAAQAAAQAAQAAAQAAQAAGPGRKKRSVNLMKMKECRSAEFHIIMDHKNMPQETSEIVEKLKSK
ncbi:unnamed protein product, partial [Onchocerca ochengi]|uniref:Translation initiation factor IF-2 n=1 Tax=Onchocerca ochengi TaxID=42157 RepID=A0A182EWK5_ONCOC